MKLSIHTPAYSRTRGFTLIEVLIYLALYALMFSGALSAVYGVIGSSARDVTASTIEEEGDFVLAKFDVATREADAMPYSPGTSTSISFGRSDGSSVSFARCGSGICEAVSPRTSERLNDPDTSVSSLTYFVANESLAGTNKTSVMLSFMLSATTSDGHVLSRKFYSLDYLHL